ncbi:MAG: hypothetical protein JETCAE03_36140 [Ignavibacteriaceae bacterium]|jgi:hypothetical protein|nr:MAG: hypothetical protein JETCAE03_36140 [Ignavibacteriaceae bacterium]
MKKNKTIIVLKEKHSDRYIDAGEGLDDRENLEKISAKIIKERIREKFWYTPEDVKEAKEAIKNKNALGWLRKRSGYEYEGFELQTLEIL